MTIFAKVKNRILFLTLLLLCFLFLIGTLFSAEKAFAEQDDYTPVLTVQSKTVHRGQTFELSVDLSKNQGLTGLKISLSYDNSVMKLTGINRGDAISALAYTEENTQTELGYEKVPFNMLWDGETPDATNGTIVNFVFESFPDARLGDYEVSLTYDPLNTRRDYDVPVEMEIHSGIVTLITGKYKVYYRDWDKTVLYEKEYNDGSAPSFVGENPSRQADAEYSYEFIGWKGVVSDEDAVIIYEANYKKTAKIYTLFYYIDGATSEPDDIIDEVEDYYYSVELSFGSEIIPTIPNEKSHYRFVGWYKDQNYTEPFEYGTMPSTDMRLYGYYKYDVRERDLPKIRLIAQDSEDEQHVTVLAEMVYNSGLAAMRLTLDYDTTALTLTGAERQDTFSGMLYSSTGTEIEEENVKFYFSSDTENSYETGVFLLLEFDINDAAEKGTYEVTFTYDYKSDATYYVGNGETKYSMLEIIAAEVPVGKINHWTDSVGKNKEIDIDIVSKDYKPINVKMFVELVTDAVEIEDDDIALSVGERYVVSSAYTIKLIQNGEEIQPNTVLTVKIKLNARERRSKNLKFCYLHDDGTLEEYAYVLEGEYLSFTTNHLSEWLIFSDYNAVGGIEDYALLIILPILLAIATMGYALIVIGKNRKRRLIND